MATLTLYPSADTYVDSANPTTNYGSAANLLFSDTQRGWVKFDLSSLPTNSFITNAVFTIFYYNTATGLYVDQAYNIKRCSDTSWTEAGITWNNAPDSKVSSTTTAQIIHLSGSSTNVKTATVTSDINDVMVENNTEIAWRISNHNTGDGSAWQCYGKETEAVIYLTLTYEAGRVDTFTTSGTWVCPYGVTTADVYAIGGGGGGGGGATGGRAGGGGGGGAYSKKIGYTVTPSTGYTVSIGAGGGGGGADVSGANGGDTYFNNTGVLLAKGGVGGISPSTGSAGGASGSGVGDIKYSGGTGGSRNGTAGGAGGSGAGTVLAGGSATLDAVGTAGDFFGGVGGTIAIGSVYGGGGGGGVSSGAAYNGAGGLVKVHYKRDTGEFFPFL